MAAMAIAVGVRADSWHSEVPSRALVVREPHHARGVERVGSVGLGGPDRVEAQPVGLFD